MASSFPIPLTTLPVGVRDFGPANLADTDTLVTLVIDRTPAGGLTATPAASIDLQIQVSLDGGATWTMAVEAVIAGGPVTHQRTGAAVDTQSSAGVFLTQFPGTGRKIKATVTVSGSPVAVSGSLTFT